MSDQATETDGERERLAREDEQRELRAQRDELPPPALVEPDAGAGRDADARERAAQGDDERPSDIAEDPGFDAVPASDHVSHGAAGADLVDEPGEPDVPHQSGFVPVAPAPAIATAASDAVFAEPPVEPRVRHNRGFGVGVVLLSTILFTAVYGGLAAALLGFHLSADVFVAGYEVFLRAPAFIVPIVAYAVFGVLTALLVNRARWWAYALTSLVAGLLVYAVSVAVVLLLAGYLTAGDAARRTMLFTVLTQPVLVAAGFAAREVLLWSGLGIAARGRRVVARNRAEREDFERRSARSEAAWNGAGGSD